MISFLQSMFVEFKSLMIFEFDMTGLGKKYFLDIYILQRSNGIFISQIKYALEILKGDLND